MTDEFIALATDTLDACKAARLMVATAESCTGGLVAGALTEIAGSSEVVERGFITYSNAAKRGVLGVSEADLEVFGAVSEPVARAMAEGALARSDAQMAVAVTGIAGPGGSEFKPEGRVCFALARAGRATQTETIEFGAIGRANVRRRSVLRALTLLRDSARG